MIAVDIMMQHINLSTTTQLGYEVVKIERCVASGLT